MSKSPNWIDLEVALRLKKLRLWRGMTQAELAKPLKITRQQMQKYETGRDRLSFDMLLQLSEALDVAIFEFFPDQPDRTPGHMTALDTITPDDVTFLQEFTRFDRPLRDALLRLAEAIPPRVGDTDETNPDRPA